MSLNDELWSWLGKEAEGDFTADLSLCFKWLVPKLVEQDLQIEICIYKPHPSCEFQWGCYINDFRDFRTGETPSLALCKAIEKLIKEEK